MTQSVIIDNELKELLKPLEPEELQQLEQSIIDEGCRDALVLWGDILIDGHNRYEICTRHGIKFETTQKHFDSYDDAKVWMIDNQLARRNLTDGWHLEYAMTKKDLLLSIGKNKMSEGGHNKGLSIIDKPSEPKHNTRNEIASSLNWSAGKVAQAEVVRKESPEAWEGVKRGELTIGGAYKQVKNPGAKQSTEVTIFSHKSVEWYTPVYILDAARRVLGNLDLDPASCQEAQANVKATTFYSEQDNGLLKDWPGKVWLNPPYSKTNGKSNQDIWAQKLIKEYTAGNTTEAILLVKAALGYKWFEELFKEWPVCFLRDRLSFIKDNGDDDGQSKQGTAIFYFGNNFDKFAREFINLGRVIPPEGVLNATLFTD